MCFDLDRTASIRMTFAANATVWHAYQSLLIRQCFKCLMLVPPLQCLRQEAHPGVQAINSPLHASLSLWPHRQHGGTPPQRAGLPLTPTDTPGSDSVQATSRPAGAAAPRGEPWRSQPAAAPAPWPKPAVRCALPAPQPGCQQLQPRAQVSRWGEGMAFRPCYANS